MEHNEGVEWSLFNEPPTLGIRERLMAANVTGIGWMLEIVNGEAVKYFQTV